MSVVGMIAGMLTTVVAVTFMQFLGVFELMAFAGHTGKSNGNNQKKERFHRRAS